MGTNHWSRPSQFLKMLVGANIIRCTIGANRSCLGRYNSTQFLSIAALEIITWSYSIRVILVIHRTDIVMHYIILVCIELWSSPFFIVQVKKSRALWYNTWNLWRQPFCHFSEMLLLYCMPSCTSTLIDCPCALFSLLQKTAKCSVLKVVQGVWTDSQWLSMWPPFV